MDFSSQQQQPYQSWQLQPQTYEPSLYNYHHHQSYYYQQYANSFDYTNQQDAQQKQHQHIHPPGVSDPSSTGLCAPSQENAYQLPAQQGSGDPSVGATMTYLTPGLQQGQQWHSQPDPYALAMGGPGLGIGVGSQPYVLHPSVDSQTPQKFGNRRGGRPSRGGHQGKSLHGKGHGQGRGVSTMSSSSITDASVGNNQQARVFRCEVCKADCTSLEVLEQHNHGKRHMKNLRKMELSKRFGEVQNGKRIVGDGSNPGKTQNSLQVDESKPGVSIKPSQTFEHQAAVQSEDEKHELENPDVLVPVEAAKIIDQRRGSKRAIRGGGRGGKRMRISGASERGPPKPKVVIPLVCDLCNVKCDTPEVLDRHLSGKKHLSKRKHFEAHQAMYGPLELQVLYPPNPITQSLLQSQQALSVPLATPEPSAPAAPLPLPSQSQNTAP